MRRSEFICRTKAPPFTQYCTCNGSAIREIEMKNIPKINSDTSIPLWPNAKLILKIARKTINTRTIIWEYSRTLDQLIIFCFPSWISFRMRTRHSSRGSQYQGRILVQNPKRWQRTIESRVSFEIISFAQILDFRKNSMKTKLLNEWTMLLLLERVRHRKKMFQNVCPLHT